MWTRRVLSNRDGKSSNDGDEDLRDSDEDVEDEQDHDVADVAFSQEEEDDDISPETLSNLSRYISSLTSSEATSSSSGTCSSSTSSGPPTLAALASAALSPPMVNADKANELAAAKKELRRQPGLRPSAKIADFALLLCLWLSTPGIQRRVRVLHSSHGAFSACRSKACPHCRVKLSGVPSAA